MPRSVLLRHDLADGSWHFDWLIDPNGLGSPDDRNLITFRLAGRPDEPRTPIEGVRLPDHRRMYLDHEGTLSGGRGSLSRIAEWPCEVLLDRTGELWLKIEFSSGPTLLHGVPVHGTTSAWRFDRRANFPGRDNA
ncbi:MAG: hypothetical protein JNK58_09710 [Phycisphaerae bacterium]|nr:hypothetical protein [Phycisphaerae bacterium]